VRASRSSRIGLLIFLLMAAACARGPVPEATATAAATATAQPEPTPTPASAAGFVTVRDGGFTLGGKPYYFVGANFWQGMNLGVDGPTGDRAQLVRELDAMRALGITNLRVMASSEGPNTEPYRMVPALMTAPGIYDESVFAGLDFLLAEMGKRGMRAVMVLNNYWQWSGGMGQYVSWSDGSAIPYPGDYGTFMTYVSRFYYCAQCQEWYRNHIARVISRVNPYTGRAYRDEPAIFSWELANEPRRYPLDWIYDTAAFIQSLDPNHMVTTGSEGEPPGESQDFLATHSSPDIDYATMHIWPQNWGWYDTLNPDSLDTALGRAHLYFSAHEQMAVALKKPLVLEEFGLARDYEPIGNIYDPSSPTRNRDRFYQAMFNQVLASASGGRPVMGDNFWAWAGHARPGEGWVGDPPHETPGWYSVYDTDFSTLDVIRAHAVQMAGLE
jgi:mannan endo-1,4-beta-mannosidase